MTLFRWLFGGGAANIGATVERVAGSFRPNAEAADAHDHRFDMAAHAQYAAEFRKLERRSSFDALVDGLNRLVRPLVTLTILGVIPAVILWPEHSAIAFAALALLPAGYWAVVSVIIGFYFGGRMQLKAQDFEKSIQSAVARAPEVIRSVARLRQLRHDSPGVADTGTDVDLSELATGASGYRVQPINPAVSAWREDEAR